MRILYLHGFDSTGEQTRANLEKALAVSRYKDLGYTIDLASYDSWTTASKIYAGLHKTLFDTFPGPAVLVGSSLGGFWANLMARENAYPCVLINPVYSPSKSLKIRQIAQLGDSYWGFEGSGHGSDIPGCRQTVLIGLKDEILDPRKVAHHYRHSNILVYFEEEKHRFVEYGPVINTIISTAEAYQTHYGNSKTI